MDNGNENIFPQNLNTNKYLNDGWENIFINVVLSIFKKLEWKMFKSRLW